jgi:hypothetical protein
LFPFILFTESLARQSRNQTKNGCNQESDS